MRARKRFGQHFLLPVWAERVVAALAPSPDDTFLEIGPGRGALTIPLAHHVRRVVALEIDRDLVEWLGPQLPHNAVLVAGDVLHAPLASLLPEGVAPADVRVVGNLPYNISTPILFRLLDLHRNTRAFRDATIMLQREVADRIAARPGSKTYGVLSIAVQMDADVTALLSLPPGAFRPAPEVHSSVIRLTFRPPAVALSDRQAFDGMVRAVFTHRRKTLANALKGPAHARGLEPVNVLRAAGVDPGRRPETLDLADLAAIANHLATGPLPSVV